MDLFLFKTHLPSFLCHLIDNSTIANTSEWTVAFISFSMTLAHLPALPVENAKMSVKRKVAWF